MTQSLISIVEIIGSVIRRTRLKDTSFIPDINEWIAECMQLLECTVTLQPHIEQLKVNFHKAKKPCGTRDILGIEYCGTRLPINRTIKDPRVSQSVQTSPMDAVFVSFPVVQQFTSGHEFYNTLIAPLEDLPWSQCEWYKLEDTHILTSFETGNITIYCNRVPVDKNGFLMIPDDGAYKEALRWFLRARLIGVDAIKDKQMSEKDCDAKFEQWAGRARESITMPSTEEAFATLELMTSLLPTDNYYREFFSERPNQYY